MKWVLTLVGGLLTLIGMAICSAPARAQALPGTTATVTCAVLDSTCGATDITFVPNSIKMSVNKRGVVSMTCTGTTTAPPAKKTTCDGESLGGPNEGNPNQPCALTLGTKAVTTDDWMETISKGGAVTLKCTAGGTDKK